MKKMLTIAAVALFGIAGAYAQQPTAAPKKATTTPAATATPVAVPATVEVDAAVQQADIKKTEAKSCDSKEKKSCDTKASGKKSCCSHKSEAKKEESVK